MHSARLFSTLAVLLVLTACSTSSNTGLAQRCTNSVAGFSISYPAGWSTNDGSVIPACSAFDPSPIEIPEASEIPFDIAITVTAEEVPFRELGQPSRWETIDSVRTTQIAGRPAMRIQSTATGEGLAPSGLRTTRYVVDLGSGRSLIAATHATEGAPYDRNRQVLDDMIRSLGWQ